MRVDQELLPIAHADFVENVRQMMPNRTVANSQLIGDFFVGETLTDQSDNFSLPLGQSVRPNRMLCSGVDLRLGHLSQIPAHRFIAFGSAAAS